LVLHNEPAGGGAMEQRVLIECRGGPWDGRCISDRGPAFHVSSVLTHESIAQPGRWSSGVYERRTSGYFWIPSRPTINR